MRIADYRGKRVDNSEWAYGYPLYIKDRDKAYILTGKIKAYPVDLIHPALVTEGFEAIEVDKNTLTQFTERVDKNENKIYEGDLIETIDYYKNKVLCEVQFDNGTFRLKGRYVDHQIYAYWSNEMKLRGNKYDNVELLKKIGV